MPQELSVAAGVSAVAVVFDSSATGAVSVLVLVDGAGWQPIEATAKTQAAMPVKNFVMVFHWGVGSLETYTNMIKAEQRHAMRQICLVARLSDGFCDLSAISVITRLFVTTAAQVEKGGHSRHPVGD